MDRQTDCTTRTTSLATGSIQPCSVHYSLGLWLCLLQAAALAEAAAVHEELLKYESEAAAQLAAESARRTQAEEAVEQYIAAHYASQAAAQVASPVTNAVSVGHLNSLSSGCLPVCCH